MPDGTSTTDQDRLGSMLLASGDLGYVWDLADDTVWWTGATAEMFGAPGAGPASGAQFVACGDAEDQAKRDEALRAHFTARVPLDFEYRLRGHESKLVWVHDRATAEFGADGKPLRLIGVLRPVTQRKLREAKLEYLANFDDLTGHYNGARLKQALDQAIAYSQRYRVPSAYLVVGVDKLGTVNDAFGHATADAVIVGVSRLLDRCLRVSDVIGRVGGDRFGIVLNHCPAPDVSVAAEKILECVRQSPIETPSGPIHVTVSAGAVSFADYGSSGQEVISRADSALQTAKGAGRDCFVGFTDSEEQRQTRRRMVAISEEVQGALKTERLVLAFQPIVTALERKVDHYECLIRLQREDGSLLPAGAFVPVVEQSVLMRLIDRRALELAVKELNAHPDVRLAINISGLTAADRSWLRALHAMVKGRPQVAARLIVEITETVALQDIEETAKFVGQLRDLGCMVALDDFGAGYSSFRNLKALAVDCVKIDGSFVRGLSENVDNQLFIRTLLGLAEGFGLTTVAECVETAADAAHLERRGVRLLQGYFFGRPSTERPWLLPVRPPLRVVTNTTATP